MLLVALRNIIQEKGRLLISLAGVTFAIMLMLVLMGIYNGAIKQFTRFTEENPTDLVIVQKGIGDYFHGASLLPPEALAAAQNTSGVKEVVPMRAQPAFLEQGGKKYDVFLASFMKESALGAPWRVDGRLDITDNEILISDTFAKKIGRSIGDNIALVNQSFTIRGLVPDATSFGKNYAWITYGKAQELTKLPVDNFIYVTLEDSSNAARVSNVISRQLPNVSVLTKQQFSENNRAELDEVFLPIIGAIVAIAVVMGTAVIGLTIYTATIDKIREYGVLKAIGVSNGQLFRTVAAQSLLVVVAGFGLGVVVSFALSQLLKEAIGIPPVITGPVVAGTAALSIIMGVAAALVPLRRLVSIDPAEVFKS